MIRILRSLLGMSFAAMARFTLPKPRDQKPSIPMAVAQPIEEKKKEETLAFTDLSSYVEKLRSPTDVEGAAMLMCRQLKEVSQSKNAVARLTLSVTSFYSKFGEHSSTGSTTLSAYQSGRWSRLKDLIPACQSDVKVGVERISVLIEEMIASMGNDGWGCMNDSSEQLQFYLARCLTSNMRYVLEHCRRTDGTGNIKLQVSFIVDERAARTREVTPEPQILVKIFVTRGKEVPVQSAHQIYFHRRASVVQESET